MKIERITTASPLYDKLQGFVQKHRLLFNSEAWLSNYQHSGVEQCAVLNNNNDVIGCFTYYRFKKAMFSFAITAPYSPDIDLFVINPAESIVGRNTFNKDVSALLSDYFNSLGLHYINLNLPASVVDTQPFIWSGYTSRSRYSYIIDLHRTPDELWNSLASEKRKSINKAVKDQLEIKESSDYRLLHSLILKSLERNDVAQNKAILEKILFSFATSQNSFAFVAWHNGVPLGTTFCVIDEHRKKAVYLFGGFDAENRHHGAGVSCMWQSILKAKALGLDHFDFEGSMRADIERYFREFGGELVPYFCVEKIKPTLRFLMRLKGHNPL